MIRVASHTQMDDTKKTLSIADFSRLNLGLQSLCLIALQRNKILRSPEVAISIFP